MTLFTEMGLDPKILSAIGEMGFERPTPVQEQTIPYLLENNSDLIVLAQTGTGKTAAFGLPVIQQLNSFDKSAQALVLSPTRELALQIAGDMENFSKNLPAVKIATIYGGADIKRQIGELAANPQIVVGTPGRTLDLIKRKKLDLSNIRWVVLDEADEMLSMGFKEDLDAILENAPEEKQTLLFSATMPGEIASMAKKYMKNVQEISVGKRNTGAENVEHHFYLVHAKDRYTALKRIADINPNIYGIVFCRTRSETKEIADRLMGDGYNADALHGDLSQAQRDHVMNRFRGKHLQMLVATDVAARGLDVNDLTHVINFSLPDDPEVYIHRSGRTGRAGKKGVSVSLVHLREKSRLRQLEKMVNKPFVRRQVPSGKEICEKQLFHLIDRVEKTEVNDSMISLFMPVIYKKLAWLDREELIKHFVSVEFNRFLQYYENAPDINVDEFQPENRVVETSGKSKRERGRRKKGSHDKNIGYSRFFFNLGKKNGVSKRVIIDLINQHLSSRGVEIGDIEVLKSFSFFEVDQRFEKEVLHSFQNKNYNGKRVGIGLAKAK